MSLPQSADVSSWTLALPGTEMPFLHPLSPPPHREVESYEKRALPPVPLNRYSCVSAFSKEVDDALATPEPVAASDQGSITLVYRRDSALGAREAEVSDCPERRANKKKREDLKVNTAGVLRAALETLRCPQPQPRSSLHKVQKISGLPNAPAFRETTPTGHSSEKKVHRLMGLGVAPEVTERERKIRAEKQKQQYSEVSPLSNYSYENPMTAVSDLDGKTAVDDSGPPWSGPGFFDSISAYRRGSAGSSAIPRPLRVVKPARPCRSPERKPLGSPGRPLSPRLRRDGATLGWEIPSDPPSPDLYHETAKQLAKDAALATPEAQRNKARQLAVEQFLQAGTASSPDSRHSSGGRQLPLLPQQHHHHHRHQPDHSPDARPPSSTTPPRPIWRPPSAQQASPRTVSASTFGRFSPRFPPQHSASASLDPRPRSRFDPGDSDSNTSPHAMGTPETVGSIPISLASSDASEANPKATLRRSRKSNTSIMAKAFRRVSATTTSSSRTTSSPSPPAPNHTPVLNTSRPTTGVREKGSTTTSLLKKTAAETTPPPRKSPLSAFAAKTAKTTDLVAAAAAGLLCKSASGIGLGLVALSSSSSGGEREAQRRRERLRSSIRVIGDGGRVLGCGLLSESGSIGTFGGGEVR